MIKTVVNGLILDWQEDASWPSRTRFVAKADVKVTLDVTEHNAILAFWGGDRKVKIKASCEDWSGSWEHLPHACYFVELGQSKVDFDLQELVSRGAVPPFDTSLKVKTGAKGVDVSPMTAPLNKKGMPATGQTAAGNVGLMPTNYIRYLLTKDPDLLNWMKAYSKGAASIGWHWDPFPKKPLDSKEKRSVTGNSWKVDTAHQPAFHYLPYLITGDRIYLDLLHHQTNSNLWDGHILQGQVRSTAWKLRNLANTVFITPDDHPLKDYFQSHWEKVLRDWPDMNMFSVGETEGFHWRARSNSIAKGKISPWMEDYLILSLCWADAMGLGVRDILEWKSNYTIKRHLSHPGYDPSEGHYLHEVGDPQTNKPVSKTWGQVKTSGNPRWHRAGHYGDLSVGAITYLANRLGTDEAKLAAKLATERLTGADERNDNPKWAIASGEFVQPPVKPKPTGIEKAAVVEIAGQFMEDVINLPDPVSEGTVEDLADGLAEQLDSLEPLETLVDQIEKPLVVNRLQTALDDVSLLPETTVDGKVGISRADTLQIVADAETDVTALPVLAEPVTPPEPGSAIRLFDNPTVLIGKVDGVDVSTRQNQGSWEKGNISNRLLTGGFCILSHIPEMEGNGVLVFDFNGGMDDERTYVSLQVDENGVLQPKAVDWEHGGSSNFWASGVYGMHFDHPGADDEGNPRQHFYRRWNNLAVWLEDGERTKFGVNGTVIDWTSNNTDGLQNNLSVQGWLCEVTGTSSSGKFKLSHVNREAAIFDPMWFDTLSPTEYQSLYEQKYAARIADGTHVPGEGVNMTVPSWYRGQSPDPEDINVPDTFDPLSNMPEAFTG